MFTFSNSFKSLTLRAFFKPRLGILVLLTLFSVSNSVYADTNGYSQVEVQALKQKANNLAKAYYQEVTALSQTATDKALNYQDYARDYAKFGLTKLKEAQSQFEDYMGNMRDQLVNPSDDFHGVYIFASLGMPLESLRALNKQAAALHIPVLIQGLYGDSFKTTFARINTVMFPDGVRQFNPKNPPMGGFAIDPLRFKQFNITRVPAFVVSQEIAPCVPESNNIEDVKDVTSLELENVKGITNIKNVENIKNKQSNFAYDCPTPLHDVLYGNISVQDALSILYKKGSDVFKSNLARLLDKVSALGDGYLSQQNKEASQDNQSNKDKTGGL
ncbi:type-F conjugative transfer system pilin assembly protein TrbC [Cysteiniphilum marinum]|uniref:type-F conjugative transfer system pilin assembly protein TrbC n=1 Tax=Cysteiniphilum marinum TaxID=2774191 RepID=UPI00193B1F25|nr:type-F conjugative transfer system pilin assembly protein TrbC [Cysteiniphilum marinum]